MGNMSDWERIQTPDMRWGDRQHHGRWVECMPSILRKQLASGTITLPTNQHEDTVMCVIVTGGSSDVTVMLNGTPLRAQPFHEACVVWNDRGQYRMKNVPDFLQGGTIYMGPVRLPSPGTLTVSSSSSGSGGGGEASSFEGAEHVALMTSILDGASGGGGGLSAAAEEPALDLKKLQHLLLAEVDWDEPRSSVWKRFVGSGSVPELIPRILGMLPGLSTETLIHLLESHDPNLSMKAELARRKSRVTEKGMICWFAPESFNEATRYQPFFLASSL